MDLRLLKMACLTVLLIRPAAAQPPDTEKGHYEKRASIVGFPSSSDFGAK